MWPHGFHVLSSTRASLSLSLSLSLSFSLSLSPLLLSFASLVFFTSVGSTLKCCFQRQVTWPIIHRSSCHNNSKIINSSQCEVYNIGSHNDPSHLQTCWMVHKYFYAFKYICWFPQKQQPATNLAWRFF